MGFPVRVGISPTLHIRGVLASEAIRKGAIVERCPIILFPTSEEACLDQTTLGKYYYEWTKDYSCIALGLGALYNHSETPNMTVHYSYRTKEIIFRAVRDIAEGEELTFHYQQGTGRSVDPKYTDFNEGIPT
jgi:SET domain-containing protein